MYIDHVLVIQKILGLMQIPISRTRSITSAKQ